MMRPILFISIFFAVIEIAVNANAKSVTYALVIGNNSPPPQSELSVLRYADDDAVRYFNFFSRFSKRVTLLTVPDGRTQQRYPMVAAAAAIPSFQHFQHAVDELSQKVAEDRVRGNTTIAYITYSGHGAYSDDGDPYLALLGGNLTHGKLYMALSKINADFTHLFIDACYAEGVVDSRGMFDSASDSQHVTLTGENVEKLIGASMSARLPGVGVVMASSAIQRTHEWSKIESGIFTHEVLSGLMGPADINLDGKIEYSELVAFISSANRSVSDSRGRIQIIARPPERNHNIPLVDLSQLQKTAFLRGRLSGLGHFYIELSNGERYLDANLGGLDISHLAIPNETTAFLVAGDKEVELNTESSNLVELTSLGFRPHLYTSRGSIGRSYERGLFSTRYGPSYYKGFIDSTGYTSVNFEAPQLALDEVDKKPRWIALRKVLSFSAYGIAGSAAVAATVFGTLALVQKQRFEDTLYYEESLKINKTYQHYTAVFWPMVSIVPLALLGGWLLMPPKKRKTTQMAAIAVSADGTMSFRAEF